MFDYKEIVDLEINIETDWAEYEFALCEDGKVYERHRGYSKGCFWTEWTETGFESVEEASKSVLNFYGAKEE